MEGPKTGTKETEKETDIAPHEYSESPSEAKGANSNHKDEESHHRLLHCGDR